MTIVDRLTTPVGEVEIFLAEREDLETVLTILDEAAQWLYSVGIEYQWVPGEFWEAQKYYLHGIEAGQIYLAKIEDQVFGTFLLRWVDQRIWGGDDAQAGYLHHLAFKQDWRGQGLGPAVLDWIGRRVCQEGREYLRLDCVARNQKLNQIYLDNGFQLVKEITYSDGELGNLYEQECG